MSTELALAESHKVVLELKKALNVKPNVFSFNVLMESAQLSQHNYQECFKNNVKKEFDDKSKVVNDYLNHYDDYVKLKSLISEYNTNVNLNDTLTELTMIQKKLDLFKAILNQSSAGNFGSLYGSTEVIVDKGHYSQENIKGCYDMAKTEYNLLTNAPQFSGNVPSQKYKFHLYDKDRVQELYDQTIKRKTELGKKRDRLNQETKFEVKLTESTKKLCGL